MRSIAVLLILVGLIPQDRKPPKTATSALGMVTAEHKDGVAAGVQILEKGGNAVDAAVATAFAMGVALPSHSGLGGRSQLLVFLKSGRAFHVDGGTQVPKGFTELTGGKLEAACIPGSPAALEMALKEGGSMPLKDVLAPAIALSKEKKQDELTATLEAIAAGGAAAFYTGKIAEAIDADMRDRGGFIRKEDLADYKAKLNECLKGTYRGFDLLTCDRPASGAVVMEALNILETFDFATVKTEADRDHVVIESLRLAFEDRKKKDVVSKEHAKKRAATIDLKKAGTPDMGPDDDGDTTHISVVDKDGNACAFTQSLGPWYGAGRAKGLGFYWNRTQGMAGIAKPGERHTTGQSPTMLIKDGKPMLVVGSAGETRIISAVVQTVHRVIDRGQTLRDAVFAPRFHWMGPHLQLEIKLLDGKELEIPRDIRDELKARGFAMSTMASDFYFGRVQACGWDAAKKEWLGVADPRGTGAAAGPTK